MKRKSMKRNKDRVLNKTPLWVIDGLKTIKTDVAKTTSEILYELSDYKDRNAGKYHTNGRYYDHSTAFLPFVLKRLGWTNITVGNNTAAKWIRPSRS